ncbi:MAG: DUF3426 domain-containing protein [Marinobacter sp.]|uniref:DUF3426 domain-containing protein n=1 Tax=Marinobacter sp. TaxID=50741 RepID=UPI0034A06CE3
MTQGTLLTRCPHCDTRFRVTNEQLGVAKGKVRCGNCMEVFSAIESRHEDMPEPVTDENASTDVLGSGGPSSEEDFVFQDDPDEDATEDSYAGTRLTFSDDELSDSFRSFDEKAPVSFDTDEDNDEAQSVDESWAEAMLFDDDQPARGNQNDREPPLTEEQEPASSDIPPPVPKPEWHSAPEVKSEPEQPASEHSLHEPRDSQPETRDSAAGISHHTPETDGSPEHDTNWTEPNDNDSSDNLKAEPNSASNPYYGLGHEPIAVRQRPSRGWLGKTIWFLVIIGLVGVLVSQMVYFQFDRLASIAELRPFYEKGCELAGCELKPLVAVDRIQSRKLVVRTAPEDRNSLIVDAVILNDAEFEQPFPAIGLTFSNLNGDVVAQSLFTPEEYLAGDARDLSVMPPNTPVRIAITIRDPGRDAVNYNISFRPNGQ